MDHFQLKFIEEASELISDLEQALLKLENNPDDIETIGSVFRVMHTLKGNSSMFGFDKIGEFTHHLETIYDNVRQGKMSLSKEIFNVTLISVDHISELLKDNDLTKSKNKKIHENLLSRIKAIINNVEEPALGNNDGEDEDSDSFGFFEEPTTYHIFFKPKEYIFNNGTNPLYLIDELYTLGQCLAFPNLKQTPDFFSINPLNCYTSWDLILTTYKEITAINDVFIFIEDDCELIITKLAERNLLNEESFINKIKSYTDSGKNINLLTIQSFISTSDPDSQQTKQITEKKAEIKTVNQVKETKESTISSIRVSSDKIDEMMNLVSELVTTQARLSLVVENYQSPELAAIAENMQKLSRQLRDTAFSISLIQIQNIITRFQRLVRDLSQELHKEIEFITEGTETELDKTIIENLTDPLMHILRNSMDHGIEDAETRIKKGKPAKGKIILSAFYSGVYVYIQVKDDGAGIDPEKIREKAISKGLISADANYSKKEILDLIFLPGFSTAAVVTDVSGRGVGMDVVRRKIAEIRGEVEIDSEVNEGTTITIKLPLTLSIIDGLLVKIQDTNFILQLNAVNKIYAVSHKEILNANRNILVLDGENIPFYYLRDEFGMVGEPDEIEQVIIVRYMDNKIGLVIDKVIGEYQAVIKPLGKHYKKQEMISGASILGDGTIALVTDTNKIIKNCSQEK